MNKWQKNLKKRDTMYENKDAKNNQRKRGEKVIKETKKRRERERERKGGKKLANQEW